MKTYMDKDVLVDFYMGRPDEQEDEDKKTNWNYLSKFLKTKTRLILNVNLEHEAKDPLSEFITIIKSFGYSGNPITCDTNRFRFKNKVDFQKEFSNADNLFFINGSGEEEVKKWKSRNGFCIACSEDLLETWRKLNLTYDIPRSLPVRDFAVLNNLTKWEDISPYQHPVTDMVVADRYLLKDKELFEVNFIPLLKSLISNRTAHFNLTLFTSKREVFEKDIRKMKEYGQALLKQSSFNCTLSLVYDTIELFREHDRHIITNYYHINAGDSFTIFKKRGGLKTKGTTIDIKPMVDENYFAVACSVLQNLKRSFDHANIEKTEGPTNRLFLLVG